MCGLGKLAASPLYHSIDCSEVAPLLSPESKSHSTTANGQNEYG